LGVEDPYLLLDQLPGLWAYSTLQWLRHTIPTDDSNRGRWECTPFWQAIQQADFFANGTPAVRERKRISDLRRGIGQIQDRKSRLVEKRTQGHYTVCVIGYTNAGKSTLFNTLTAAGTYADNKLFATLDTKTRAWKLDRALEVLLSDTVGFVRDLPHNLVASFKATLEEAVHADLLLHVLDVGHPHAEAQFKAVHEVLKEIGAAGKPELLLLNKVDTEEGQHNAKFWKTLHPDALTISARAGTGLGDLLHRVAELARARETRATVYCPITDGRLFHLIRGTIPTYDERMSDTEIVFDVSVNPATLARLEREPALRVERADVAEVEALLPDRAAASLP